MTTLLTAPPEEPAVVAAPSPAPGRVARLRVVADFCALEALQLLRLPVSLRAFRWLVLVAGWVGALALGLVTWTGLGLLSASLQDRPGQQAAVVATGLFANLYLGLAHLLGELATRRRYRLSNSPNVALFRALDLSAAHVLAVYAALPGACVLLLVLLVDVGLLVAFAGPVGLGAVEVLSLLAVPVALSALTLALQARAAGRPRSGRGASSAWWLCPLLLAVGWATGTFAVAPLLADGPGAGTPPVQGLLHAAGVGALGVLALALAVLAPAVRRLRTHPYVLQEQPAAAEAVGQVRVSAVLSRLPSPLPVVLHREWAGSWAATLGQKTLTGLLAAVCLCLGLRVSGAGLPLTGVPTALGFSAEVVTYALVLGLVDVTLTHVGVVKLGPHLRSAWELGLDARTAAWSVVGLLLVPVLALAGLVVVLFLVLLGQASPAPLAVAVTVLAAAVLAESVVPPVRNTDGTAVPDALSALVAVAITAPVMVLTYSGSGVLTLAASVYAAVTLRGAVGCLQRRIVLHSSSSAT